MRPAPAPSRSAGARFPVARFLIAPGLFGLLGCAAPDPEIGTGAGGGIGLRNVDERLRVIYGENYRLRLESAPGRGTCARIEIPLLDAARGASA